MPHDSALIATIPAGIDLAFDLGLAATRLRLPSCAKRLGGVPQEAVLGTDAA
jgi:predicted Kef-type K+ transport protein